MEPFWQRFESRYGHTRETKIKRLIKACGLYPLDIMVQTGWGKNKVYDLINGTATLTDTEAAILAPILHTTKEYLLIED